LGNTIIMIIEIQGRGTALLLLVNPCILDQNNGTMLPQLYQLVKYSRYFVAGYLAIVHSDPSLQSGTYCCKRPLQEASNNL